MSMSKQASRTRRGKKTRKHIERLRVHRLTVHKTNQHIYAQILEPVTGRVCAVASTVSKSFKATGSTSNIDSAKQVGSMLAELAKKAGVKSVAFDRSGFKYHGRVKALADGAREGGIEF
jgi:large subunit ribosomal protein L18